MATTKKSLTFVQPETRRPTLRVLLYGPPGTGKSTAAATMPGPLLYLNAEASTALDFARSRGADVREFPVTGKQSLVDASLYLRDGGDGEQTVVLDPVEDVWRILVEEMAPSGRPTLQQFGDAGTMIERFCRYLCKDSGMNVVLVCHENPMDTGDGVILMPMTGGRKNPQILAAMCDVVGYTAVIQRKDEAPRYVAKVVPDERRYAKNRNGILPPVADLDLGAWLDAYTKFATPKKEK
jgi:DNA polymerase III delta prime subunit